jgi:hypothetical protein
MPVERSTLQAFEMLKLEDKNLKPKKLTIQKQP